MANEEHLKILKQGVEVWNQWRKEYPDVKPDLSKVDLSKADLHGVHLNEVNLREANLHEAILYKAILSWADLHEATLSKVDLNGTDLRGTDFYKADLRKTSLIRAILVRANLNKADLHRADLRGADFRGATFVQTNLSEADITGAKLYGTARDDWVIDGIKCEYVFWDWEWKNRTPKDRNFRSGEFEELYKHLPTFEYYFKHGFTALDAVVMSRVVQAINDQRPEFELKLDSFHSRGQPHAKFTILHKEYVEEAHHQIIKGYETRIQSLEGQMEEIQKRLAMLGDQPKMLISNLTVSGGEFTMGDKHIGRDNIEISGNAQVTQLTTGASFQGDHAQQLLQSTTPQSSKEDILKLLSFVQQELPKLPLPDDVKEEVTNEVKGAEIQAKKEEPDKKKIGEKLQSATEALEKVPKLTKAAITVGNLLGQAIVWCGMKWVEWKYGG